MLLSGILANTVLSIIPSDQFLKINSISIGTHWTVPATLAAVLGMQLIWLGLFSTVYAINNELYPTPSWFAFIRDFVTSERSLILGLIVIFSGLFLEGFILIKWILNNFGELQEIRLAIYGMMWIVLGVEVISSNFLLNFMNSKD